VRCPFSQNLVFVLARCLVNVLILAGDKQKIVLYTSDQILSVCEIRGGGEVSRSHKNPLMASVTFVYCVETAKDTAIVAMECE